MMVMVFNLEKKQNRFIKNVDSNRISTICGSLSKINTEKKKKINIAVSILTVIDRHITCHEAQSKSSLQSMCGRIVNSFVLCIIGKMFDGSSLCDYLNQY